jgi:hypothetical protein
MVGLHLLKHCLNPSDQQGVQGLYAKLHWRAFCKMDVRQVAEQAKPGEPFRFVDASTLIK